MARTRLANRRLALTEAVEWNGQPWQVSIGFDRDGAAREIFVKGMKSGSALAEFADDMCILVSRLLQHGERAADLSTSLGGQRETGVAPPTLVCAALAIAARLEGESAATIREAYLEAEGRHPTPRAP